MYSPGIRVDVPFDVPYDLVVGGACRDALAGEKKAPRDYDLWYTNEISYLAALILLLVKGAVEMEEERRESAFFFGKHYSRSVWELNGVVFDLRRFFVKGGLGELEALVRDRFDFRVNACYQRFGGVVESVAGEDEYAARVLEQNDVRKMTLGRILDRCRHLSKRGWVVGGTVASSAFGQISDMFEDPEGGFIDDASRFVRDEGSGYSVRKVVCSKSVFGELFPLIPTEHLIFGFLSSSDDVVRATMHEYNRRQKGPLLRVLDDVVEYGASVIDRLLSAVFVLP